MINKIDCLIGFEFHKFEKDECLNKRFFENLMWFEENKEDYLMDCPFLSKEEKDYYIILKDCIGYKVDVVKEILDYDHESYMDELVSIIQYVAEQNENWGYIVNDCSNFNKLQKMMLNAFKKNNTEKVSIVTAWEFKEPEFRNDPIQGEHWNDAEHVLLGQINMNSIEILGEEND